jgi:hypothetical protein
MVGAAVARADQCAGVCGFGLTKSGPTVHAASIAVNAAALNEIPMRLVRLGIMVIACGG